MYYSPHAIDNDFFDKKSSLLRVQRSAIRREYGFADNSIVYLFAGKLIPKKRPYDFVKALQIANKRNQCIQGLIVGDGPLRLELERYCEQATIPITFLGFFNQTQISKAYIASDALVLTSDSRETWGLVVNEAMASGLACFVSDQAGCGPDLIVEGETGAIFPCADITTLANTLYRFSLTADALKNMGQKAQHLISRFSIVSAAQGIITAVEKVAADTTRPN
jgi:glycosyltransferase involved in cell wall biosynthesis